MLAASQWTVDSRIDRLTEILNVARRLRPLARPVGRAVTTTILHILFAEANAGCSHLG
jgi:hypothetical protein